MELIKTWWCICISEQCNHWFNSKMACCLFIAKPLCVLVLPYSFSVNMMIFTDENLYENVIYKLLSNSFWPESANWLCISNTNSNGWTILFTKVNKRPSIMHFVVRETKKLSRKSQIILWGLIDRCPEVILIEVVDSTISTKFYCPII